MPLPLPPLLLHLLACSCSGPVDTASPDADDTAPAEAADADQDGSPADVDCDDSDPDVHPGAEEACGDGVDQDCDGVQPACSGTMPASESAGVVFGTDATDWTGKSIAVVHDWTADGSPLVLLGAPGADVLADAVEVRETAGSVFAIRADSFRSRGDVAAVSDWRIDGSEAHASVGYHVLTGDVNGDDISDFVTTAIYSEVDSPVGGAVWIVSGPLAGGTFLDSSTGVRVASEIQWEDLGRELTVSPDATGDGQPDVIAAFAGVCDAAGGAGGAYVLADRIDQNRTVDGDDVRYDDQTPCWGSASALSTIDLNGDGVEDMAFGSKLGGSAITFDAYTGYSSAEDGPGYVYLQMGPLTASGSLADADTLLIGPEAKSLFGRSIADAGDLDGDGIHDLALGAPWADQSATDSGAAWVISGPRALGHGTIEVDSTAFASIVGDRTQNLAFGYGLSTAGDIDADGHLDLLVSAQGEDDNPSTSGRGHVYAFRGPFDGTVVHSDAAVRIDGNHGGDHLGYYDSYDGTIYGGFDLNADGYDDWIAGAELVDEGQIGAAYLFYGGVWE